MNPMSIKIQPRSMYRNVLDPLIAIAVSMQRHIHIAPMNKEDLVLKKNNCFIEKQKLYCYSI